MKREDSRRPKLSPGDQLSLHEGVERLKRRFGSELNPEAIERFVDDSLEALLQAGTEMERVPFLAERLAADRIRALIRLEGDQVGLKPSVLFLCVHNAGRSQMAAGFARALSGERVDVFSGGSEPAGSVNEAAVAVMAEKGIDISAETPQPWADEIVRTADVVVTMGCGDVCPIFPGKRYVDWDLADPAGKVVDQVRPIRDDVEGRVRGLLEELGVEIVA